jgi:hypothetical protein
VRSQILTAGQFPEPIPGTMLFPRLCAESAIGRHSGSVAVTQPSR